MTKTSVNKIKFKGPKTHNEILAKIRTDTYDAGTGYSVETISFVVSSFFSKEGVFRNIEEKKRISHLYFGIFYPATKIYLRADQTKIRRRKRKAAIRYLKWRHRNAYFGKQEGIFRWFNNLNKYRAKIHTSQLSFERFLVIYKVKWPTKDYPITEKSIQDILYKFNDKGKVISRRGSKKNTAYIIERNQKEKQQKALSDQH